MEDGVQTSSSKKPILIVVGIFVLSVTALFFLYTKLPEFDKDELDVLKLPKNIEDAKSLGRVLDRYKEKYFYEVLGGVFVVYIFLQSFAIPGSIFLSILSGFLFPFPVALFLVCLCSAAGASVCYIISYLIGRRLVQQYFPERVTQWAQQVRNHGDHLLFYIIFLRITPFLPNWFINIAAPVLGVPLSTFFVGTFIGVAPPSFVAIHAGTTLHRLSSSSEAFSWKSMGLLGVLALLSLLPVFMKRKIAEKMA